MAGQLFQHCIPTHFHFPPLLIGSVFNDNFDAILIVFALSPMGVVAYRHKAKAGQFSFKQGILLSFVSLASGLPTNLRLHRPPN